VNHLVDNTQPIAKLTQDPVAQLQALLVKRNPKIPLPGNIFKAAVVKEDVVKVIVGKAAVDKTGMPIAQGRKNSRGVDLSDAGSVHLLTRAMDNYWKIYQARTLPTSTADVMKSVNPANTHEVLGAFELDQSADIERKLDGAHRAFKGWSATSVHHRALCLRDLAQRLEEHCHELTVLCVKEAGKTLADGVAEVREAVDFCRYYADQAESIMADPALKPRGVIVCISPWNFPVAIFIGQVVAALVTGNCVVAKPAGPTCLLAQRIVALMSASGLPAPVVQLLLAPGRLVGELVVPDARVQGVMFTGSMSTARELTKCLAERAEVDLPLVAETGGQNAMIVDSTALVEQVVDDVIQSAFGGAGQRCSALRVLFLQEEVADSVISQIKGAMDELNIGDPALLSTDVGPVINAAALAVLATHVQRLKQPHSGAQLLHRCSLPEVCAPGHFFAPHLYELERLSVLNQEVFGPVVHVIRFKASELDDVVAQINESGYGLTLGVHSRIARVGQRVVTSAQVGNVYINRNMVGAVVGVQPFGGRGLSGTGPKAGGPHYLLRLLQVTDDLPFSDLVASSMEAVLPAALNEQSHNPWRALLLKQREKHLKRVVGALQKSTFLARNDWQQPQAFECMLRVSRRYLDLSVALPGPTGECNVFLTQAKGHVFVVTAPVDALGDNLRQVMMALLAGNTVSWLVASNHRDKAAECERLMQVMGLDERIIQIKVVDTFDPIGELIEAREVQAVLVLKGSVYSKKIHVLLAQRAGPLLPVIEGFCPALVMPRLQWEKTISTNTTAAGGNASLLTL